MSDKILDSLLVIIIILFIITMAWIQINDSENSQNREAEDIRYEQESIPRFNALNKPVILIGKTKISERYYDIVVRDGNNTFQTFTSDCTLANTIGSSKNVGDTLK